MLHVVPLLGATIWFVILGANHHGGGQPDYIFVYDVLIRP